MRMISLMSRSTRKMVPMMRVPMSIKLESHFAVGLIQMLIHLPWLGPALKDIWRLCGCYSKLD